MKKVLGKAFFNRPALVVARELLGKYLVRKRGGREVALMITETEAYVGPHDLAAHSSRGRTARTEVLFGPAGVWYVYFVYGMHEMLNIVTKQDGAAVLIRGVEGHAGPAKLTHFLKISRALNKKPAAKASGLWIEDRGVKIPPKNILKSPRIGIAYAGRYVTKPWRFVIDTGARPPRLRRGSRAHYGGYSARRG